MRLFGIVDGTVDRRDRAGWLTMPFDVDFVDIVFGPFFIEEFDVVNGGVFEIAAVVSNHDGPLVDDSGINELGVINTGGLDVLTTDSRIDGPFAAELN